MCCTKCYYFQEVFFRSVFAYFGGHLASGGSFPPIKMSVTTRSMVRSSWLMRQKCFERYTFVCHRANFGVANLHIIPNSTTSTLPVAQIVLQAVLARGAVQLEMHILSYVEIDAGFRTIQAVTVYMHI